jgi:hypothetical protein
MNRATRDIILALVFLSVFLLAAIAIAMRIGEMYSTGESLITTTDQPLAPILVKPLEAAAQDDSVRLILVGKLVDGKDYHLSFTCAPTPVKGDR